jgi:hypothetical protein
MDAAVENPPPVDSKHQESLQLGTDPQIQVS